MQAQITWQASDPDRIASIDLFVSHHGSAGPFEAIARGLPNSGAYDWTVTGPLSDSVVVKIVARDAAGNIAIDRTPRIAIRDLVGVATAAVPTRLSIRSVSPNPARSNLAVSFVTPGRGRVRLALHDVQGRRVAILLDEDRPGAAGTVEWPISGRVRSGLYFLRIDSGGTSAFERVLLVR
jgi:hypothetical protein